MEQLIQFELSKEYLEKLKEAIDARDDLFIRSSLENVKSADIASLFYEIDSADSKYVIEVLSTESGAEIINDLDTDFRQRFLKNFNAEEIADFVNYLDSDDAVDILNEIPVKKREEVIANLESEEQASYILDLLRYEEDCAGGLMAKELIKANVNWTIVQCIDEIRRQAENVTKIYSVYVVDNQQKLLGRVSLKRIILSEDNTRIADIYDTDVVSVETYLHEEEVAEIMRKYDLEAVPVVNVQGKLVGRITIDDIIDVITNMAEEERQLMSGISESVEEDDTVWVLSRARLPWLIIGMVGGMLGAQFIGIFEKDIAIIPALAFFIPLITATGGNVGIQSSSIVLQSLANRSVFEDSLAKRLFKVTAVALLNGVVLAAFVFAVTIIIWNTQKLSLVVAIALFCVVLLASVMGTITPLILDKFKINPALASGPFITTANDLLGLGVYFTVAHLLYNL
ncbi:MAG: magnesium transporter [Bacteroidota bacterium]|nr:magnesium transporter [Bacteroidota bacterium]